MSSARFVDACSLCLGVSAMTGHFEGNAKTSKGPPLKKILLIDGHPDETRLTSALMSAYRSGAEEAGYQVSQILIRELAFEPNLKFGYQQRLELEPDLLAAIDAIKACDHMAVSYTHLRAHET